MKMEVKHVPTRDNLVGLFNSARKTISTCDPSFMAVLREKAIEAFGRLGFPTKKMEEWKSTSLADSLLPEYSFYLTPHDKNVKVEKIFRCEIHNFGTYLYTQLNGWYYYEDSPLTVLDGGVIIGSFAAAIKQYPELVQKHYSRYADIETNGLIALNTAFAQDGMFIYVPDGVKLEKPLQMVNVVDTPDSVFIQPRNLVILGKNSKLTLVHCDDSIRHERSFINAVTEVFCDEGSEIDYYKLQNKDDQSAVINNNFFHQEDKSVITTNTLTLNGGMIRNETRVAVNGSDCVANVYGLYLTDRKQHTDNQVYIDHIKPGSSSFELFKGILDDDASAVFSGHVLVRQDAQKTIAMQSNRNILLTDTATINTQPFLEIYADDVKCSHGATVGQLDPDAMFYIKSRGICDRNAKMLLMYAFAAEVSNKIQIEVLRERIDSMIVKRLKGELSICDACNLHCKDNDAITFEIDMSKIP